MQLFENTISINEYQLFLVYLLINNLIKNILKSKVLNKFAVIRSLRQRV